MATTRSGSSPLRPATTLRQQIGSDHQAVIYALRIFAMTEIRLGRPDAATSHVDQLLDIAERVQPAQAPSYLAEAAGLFLEHGFAARAQTLYERLIDRRAEEWQDDWRADRYRSALAIARAMQGAFAEHEDEILLRVRRVLAARPSDTGLPRLRDKVAAAKTVLRYYEAWHESDAAAGADRKVDEWRARVTEIEER
jgi:hypothetical protein